MHIDPPIPEQAFSSFEDWVSRATVALTKHPEYNNTEHARTKGWQGEHYVAICFDAKGRRCRNGGDFITARDEGTFPVWWVWPNQIPAILAKEPAT